MASEETRSPVEIYSRNAEKMAEEFGEESLTENLVELRDSFISEIEGKRVLDAGCGTGRDCGFFSEKGLQPVGLDAAEGMVEYARENREGSFVHADLRDAEFEEESFAGIFCCSTIFFLEPGEIRRVLEKFGRWLQDEGMLYIDFKLGDGEHVKERWGSRIREYRFSGEECREMLEEAGFETVEEGRSEVSEESTFANFLCRRRKQNGGQD